MKKEMVCENPCCGEYHGYYKHAALRIVLALLILGFVFHMGVRLGEFKAMIESGYGYGGRHMTGDRVFMMRSDMDGILGKKMMAPVPATTTEEGEAAN